MSRLSCQREISNKDFKIYVVPDDISIECVIQSNGGQNTHGIFHVFFIKEYIGDVECRSPFETDLWGQAWLFQERKSFYETVNLPVNKREFSLVIRHRRNLELKIKEIEEETCGTRRDPELIAFRASGIHNAR